MVDTNHFVKSNGQNILIYAEILQSGSHLEMDAILRHFQSFLFLTLCCNRFVMSKKTQTWSFMIFLENLPYLCRNCAKWRPSWNGRHFEPLPFICRFDTMLQSICHVKKSLDMKFHDFGRKTTTPIKYLDLEPNYIIRQKDDCHLDAACLRTISL